MAKHGSDSVLVDNHLLPFLKSLFGANHVSCLVWTRKGRYSCCFCWRGFWFLNRSVLTVNSYIILRYPRHLVA